MKEINTHVICKDKKLTALVRYSTQEPWELNIKIDGLFNFSCEGTDLFEAFKEARIEATKYNIVFLCYGSKINVHPSPMTRSMTGGVMAYTLHKGIPARRKDIVNIFEYSGDIISPLDDQKIFYNNWLDSLKTNKYKNK